MEYKTKTWFHIHGFSFLKKERSHFQFRGTEGFLVQVVKSGPLTLKPN